jgi:hypothetical protein
LSHRSYGNNWNVRKVEKELKYELRLLVFRKYEFLGFQATFAKNISEVSPII